MRSVVVFLVSLVLFAAEVAAVVFLAMGGAELEVPLAVRIAVAIVLPAAAVLAWHRWAAPRASHRGVRAVVVTKTLVLGTAVGALAFVAGPVAALVFGVVVAATTVAAECGLSLAAPAAQAAPTAPRVIAQRA